MCLDFKKVFICFEQKINNNVLIYIFISESHSFEHGMTDRGRNQKL